MRPALKKSMFHLAWSPDSLPTPDAISPLLEYLDAHLVNLNAALLPRNFERVLADVWDVSLLELGQQMDGNAGVRHQFVWICNCVRLYIPYWTNFPVMVKRGSWPGWLLKFFKNHTCSMFLRQEINDWNFQRAMFRSLKLQVSYKLYFLEMKILS